MTIRNKLLLGNRGAGYVTVTTCLRKRQWKDVSSVCYIRNTGRLLM